MTCLARFFGQLDKRNNQDGLTLIELLVAMAIAAFVGLAIYELFLGFMGDWTRTAANSNVMADANIVLTRLGEDIRLAQNPNSKTKAVVVVVETGSNNAEIKNHRLDIYRYDENSSRYQRISYRVEAATQNGRTINLLKRGFVETSDPGSDANPQYGTISNWQTILEGLSSTAVFFDRTADANTDRRLIEIIVSLNDTQNSRPQYNDFQIKTSYMSRSQPLNALTGSGGGSLIRVTGVTVSPTYKEVVNDPSTFRATATIIPDNASNTNVHWTSDSVWLTVNDTSSLEVQVSVTTKNKNRKPRTGYLTVTTEDGNKTATIKVTQSGS